MSVTKKRLAHQLNVLICLNILNPDGSTASLHSIYCSYELFLCVYVLQLLLNYDLKARLYIRLFAWLSSRSFHITVFEYLITKYVNVLNSAFFKIFKRTFDYVEKTQSFFSGKKNHSFFFHNELLNISLNQYYQDSYTNKFSKYEWFSCDANTKQF